MYKNLIIFLVIITIILSIILTVVYLKSYYTWVPAIIKNPLMSSDATKVLKTPIPVVPYEYDVGFGAADPFIVKDTKKTFVFAEIMKDGKGIIAAAQWDYRNLLFRPVLEETFHLSYPQVFQHSSKWYMIPEAYQSGSILLYESRNFPYQWEKVKSIYNLDGIDSTVFKLSNQWYMFTTSEKSGRTLILTTKNFPEGPWSVVKENPLDNGYRGGGQAIYQNEDIFLPLQPPSTIIRGYGFKLEVYKVKKDLSLEYTKTIMPPKGAGGLHHLVCIPGTDQCMVDLRRYKKR